LGGFLPAIAAGLLFLACLGLVAWLFWRGKAAEAPEPELLRYLPNYSQIVISLRPPSIAKSQVFRRLARRSPKVRKLEAEFEEGSGLPLARVKQMMVSIVGNDEPVVACRMDSTIHVADMFANMREPRSNYSEEKVAGHIIHVKNRANAFSIVRQDLVLFGHLDTLQAILLREGPPELSGGLKTAMNCADFSKDCVVVMNSKDLLRKAWSRLNLEANEPHELMDAIMLADAAVAAEASFGEVMEEQLIIHCKDADTAKELWELWNDPRIQRELDALFFGCERRHKLRGAEITTTARIDLDSFVRAMDEEGR
jgi:hypothetical protein